MLALAGSPSAWVPPPAHPAPWVATAVSREGTRVPSGPLASQFPREAAPGIVNSIRVGAAPTSIAYDFGKHELFVVNSNSNNVSVIADGTGRIVATISVGSFPYGVAYDPDQHEVYVTNSGSDNVSVISDVTNQVVAEVSLSPGDDPCGILFVGGALYVANYGANDIVQIVDTTNTIVNSYATGMGSAPLELAFDSGLADIFASLHGSGQVWVLRIATGVTGTIGVGQSPIGVAYDAAKSEIFVANNGSNSVSIIADGNDTIVANVSVGANPSGVAYGPGTGEVAVTYTVTFSSTTYAMLGLIADANNTVVGTVGLYGGGAANAVVYDTGNRGWYVADTAAEHVVVVVTGNAGFPVVFTETGLSAGVGWQLWFNGTGPWGRSEMLYDSTTSSLLITAGNGSYTFAVVPLAGYRASPASGAITVAGALVSQPIAFTFVYSVTFTENGLPTGMNWSVTFSGVSETSSTARIMFDSANGTHPFSVAAVSGYAATPGSGNVTIAGAAASQTVAFTATSAGGGPGGGLFGLPGIAGIAVIVAIVLVVAVAGFLMLRRQRGKAPPTSGTPPQGPGLPPP